MNRLLYKRMIIGIFLFLNFPLFGQLVMPYDGVDSLRGIVWRFSPGMSRTDPQWRILKEYELYQSDYLVVANCVDSSMVYSFPWKWPQKCLKYHSENVKRMDHDSLNKYVKMCWQDYYYDLSNAAIRDTVYIDPNNSAIMFDGTSEEDLFFLKKEKHFSPNSSDSTVLEFYGLKDVKRECIDGYYFRRKSLKMYADGKPNGTWIFYDLHGEMVRRTEYKIGVVIKDETF